MRRQDRRPEQGRGDHAHNEILRRRPDLLDVLYRPFFWSWNAQRFPEVPRFTPEQTEALDLLDVISADEDFHITYAFQPGDIQLLNNHTCFHARTAFEDHPEHDRRRHLLRMWLAVENSRPLSPLMGTIYKDQRAGVVRGGFPSRSGRHIMNRPARRSIEQHSEGDTMRATR